LETFQTSSISSNEDIESIRSELIDIVKDWPDSKYNETDFTYICGLLSSDQDQIVVITKSQAIYMISRCQDIEKLRRVLDYVSRNAFKECVIL
jgi:hypothetical protein